MEPLLWIPNELFCGCGADIYREHACRIKLIHINGVEYERIPYGRESYIDATTHVGKYCRGCRVAVGSYHHCGCGAEVCPKCGRRLMVDCQCSADSKP